MRLLLLFVDFRYFSYGSRVSIAQHEDEKRQRVAMSAVGNAGGNTAPGFGLLAAVNGGQQGETPTGLAVSRVEPVAQAAAENQLEQTMADPARTWRARPKAQEAFEFTMGATACGIGFTRFLGGAAAAVTLSTAATVGLGVAAAAFTAADVVVAVSSHTTATEREGIWKAAQSDATQGDYRTELQNFRGGAKKDVGPATSAQIKFALDPRGRGEGVDRSSHLSQLSAEDQHEQLDRVAKYAQDKCVRKADRKMVEGTLSFMALYFGVASLATGVLTPPGLLFGTIALGFGIARGCCKLASWGKAAFKAQQGTLGHAREQNAKAIYEIATSSDAKQEPKNRALKILTDLGIKPERLEDPAKRDGVIVDIMLRMRS